MKPVQYIKGFVEWYKLTLKVTPDVLIPRPETELLVDEVIAFTNILRAKREVSNQISSRISSNNNTPVTILDIGTGSGNIAIALAKNLNVHPKGVNTNIKIVATDISEKALKIAQQNAKLHGVSDKIKFVQSDLLSSVILHPPTAGEESLARHHAPSRREKYLWGGVRSTLGVDASHIRDRSFANAQDDNLIIATNLPYIPTSRIPTLDSSVKDFEPYIALDGGENGFELYEKLFIQITEKGLNFDLLIGEIDYTHADLAVSIAKKYFKDMDIEVKKDLAKMPRILTIQKVT